MKLSDLAIKRPVTTVIMVLLVVLLGVIAFNRVHVDLLPNITLPVAVVITNYEGVGPEEIETMVTRPIESAVATVTNISNLSSSSSTGSSIVMVEFNWGTDMDMATLDMREKIDLVEGYLPDGVSKPIIVQFDPSMLPIMQLGGLQRPGPGQFETIPGGCSHPQAGKAGGGLPRLTWLAAGIGRF